MTTNDRQRFRPVEETTPEEAERNKRAQTRNEAEQRDGDMPDKGQPDADAAKLVDMPARMPPD